MKRLSFLIFALLLLNGICNKTMAGFLLQQYTQIRDKRQEVPSRNKLLSRHFIIAVDGAMPKYTNELSRPSTKTYVEQLLNDYFGYNEKDYLSVVTYQIDLSTPNFDDFAFVPVDSNGKYISWRTQKKVNFSEFGDWGNITCYQHSKLVGANKASFQSAAKQYILQATRQTSNLTANETYILMLSDEKINGTDDNYQLEWNNISTAKGSHIEPYKEEVFSKLKKINQRYQFEPVKIYGQYKHEFAHIAKEPFVLSIYKVRPTTIPSIHSIANIPAQLPFKKVRGGYAFDLDLKTIDEHYTINRTELMIDNKNKKYSSTGRKLNETISKELLSEGDTVTLKVWVVYKDGIYNGLIMNPYDKEYDKGLTISQSVVFKDDAKILGKIPMFDILWWFWANDVQSIVIFWDIIFILIFIAIICALAYKLFIKATEYKPNNEVIKIRPMQDCSVKK